MNCPICKIAMKYGIAIEAYNERPPIIVVAVKDLKIIDVLKCPECGYSWSEKDDR